MEKKTQIINKLWKPKVTMQLMMMISNSRKKRMMIMMTRRKMNLGRASREKGLASAKANPGDFFRVYYVLVIRVS